MKKYLIATSDFKTVLDEQIRKHKPEYVLYRDKENPNYKADAIEFVKMCKKYNNLKCFLHREIDLAKSLGADGVHLTSTQFDKVEYAKSLGLEVIVSTHTKEEVLDMQNKGANGVTYSPIFHSPHKGQPKGVADLAEVVNMFDIKVFALGGIISQDQINQIEKTNCYGFASIRYFSS